MDKIDNNIRQLSSVCQENKIVRKENDTLKTRLDKLEQGQLRNDVMITGIQEGPYKQYSTTKLQVQEMIVVTINSGNMTSNLEVAKSIEITSFI